MGPFGGTDVKGPAVSGEGLGVLGPGSRGEDRGSGTYVVIDASLEVPDYRTAGGVTIAEETHCLGSVDAYRAEAHRRPHDLDHEPRVVDLGVVVLDGSDQ